MARLPQYENRKRMERGNRKFISSLLDKIQQNNPAEIAALPSDQLHERLMELATELLNKNLNKANFWHSRTEEEDLANAEDLITEVVNDIEFMEVDSAYNVYVDLIRTLTQQDQSTDGDPSNKSHAGQGSNILDQDLYVEPQAPIYGMLKGEFEVFIPPGAAIVAPLPANPSRNAPATKGQKSRQTTRRRRRSF